MTIPRPFGLVGGLGPGATIYYYRELVKSHEAYGCRPDLTIVNADNRQALEFVEQGDLEGLARYLRQILLRLLRSGAEFAAIPAVTPHICLPVLDSPIPLVSIFEPTRHEISRLGLNRVAIFGTRFTMESQMFGALDGLEVVNLRPDEVDLVHSIYIETVANGEIAQAGRAEMVRVASRLKDEEAIEAIVLAGTDFSGEVSSEELGLPLIDCARLQIAMITRLSLGIQ